MSAKSAFIKRYPLQDLFSSIRRAQSKDDVVRAYVAYARARDCEANMPQDVRQHLNEIGAP